MLFLMCKADGPDTDIYVQNDDKRFARKDGGSIKVPDSELMQQATRKLGKQVEPSQKEIEALKRAERERKSRSRDERALRRQMRPQASRRPLGSLVETSREPHARQLIPPSQTTERLGRDLPPLVEARALQASSASNNQEAKNGHNPGRQVPRDVV
jgi:hypothetical protein